MPEGVNVLLEQQASEACVCLLGVLRATGQIRREVCVVQASDAVFRVGHLWSSVLESAGTH